VTPPIVLWTARLAVGCWIVRWLVEAHPQTRSAGTGRIAPPRAAILWWTAGCLLHLGHVAAAFHLVHDWSHAAAWEHTAQRTAAVTGLDWGGGVWLNDLFTLLWPLDVLRLWVERSRGRRVCPAAMVRCWHLFSLAMVVSATILFGPVGWTAIALFAAVVWWGLRRSTIPDPRD
jgi:hypothetical protein